MSTHQIHIFISHAWDHSGHYDTLDEWIFTGSWRSGPASFNFQNYSIPKDDPIHDANSVSELQIAIFNQIKRSHVIVIPTGMYAQYSKWIKKEIAGAKSYSKPILAVTPWAQVKESSVVKNSADKHVGWNKESVIAGIWNLHHKKD